MKLSTTTSYPAVSEKLSHILVFSFVCTIHTLHLTSFLLLQNLAYGNPGYGATGGVDIAKVFIHAYQVDCVAIFHYKSAIY